jgi:hypothetical protein
MKENEMDRVCSTNVVKRNSWSKLMGKPEGKEPLARKNVSRQKNLKWILGR